VEHRVGMMKLVMVRVCLMSVYVDRFSCADVRVLIDLICSYWILFCVFIFQFYFILMSYYIHVSCLTVYVYYVYFVYDFLNNNNRHRIFLKSKE